MRSILISCHSSNSDIGIFIKYSTEVPQTAERLNDIFITSFFIVSVAPIRRKNSVPAALFLKSLLHYTAEDHHILLR